MRYTIASWLLCYGTMRLGDSLMVSVTLFDQISFLTVNVQHLAERWNRRTSYENGVMILIAFGRAWIFTCKALGAKWVPYKSLVKKDGYYVKVFTDPETVKGNQNGQNRRDRNSNRDDTAD